MRNIQYSFPIVQWNHLNRFAALNWASVSLVSWHRVKWRSIVIDGFAPEDMWSYTPTSSEFPSNISKTIFKINSAHLSGREFSSFDRDVAGEIVNNSFLPSISSFSRSARFTVLDFKAFVRASHISPSLNILLDDIGWCDFGDGDSDEEATGFVHSWFDPCQRWLWLIVIRSLLTLSYPIWVSFHFVLGLWAISRSS